MSNVAREKPTAEDFAWLSWWKHVLQQDTLCIPRRPAAVRMRSSGQRDCLKMLLCVILKFEKFESGECFWCWYVCKAVIGRNCGFRTGSIKKRGKEVLGLYWVLNLVGFAFKGFLPKGENFRPEGGFLRRSCWGGKITLLVWKIGPGSLTTFFWAGKRPLF